MQSSPSPDDRGPVPRPRLRVSVGSPLAEVFLIDHAFALVDRSVGDLDTQVEQGVYRVKAKLGGATAERLIVLEDDEYVDLKGELWIASPAPIEGTSRTHEYHIEAAEAESTHTASSVGRGAEIFFMTRRWTARNKGDAQPETSPEVSLHWLDGRPIVQPDWRGRGDGDYALGTTVEVDPGAYVLRWRDSSGIVGEQSVHAVEGWQTQVFLLEEVIGEDQTPSFRRSVLMGRGGFDPQDSMLRTVEEARSALAGERMVASDLVSDALLAKFENPMLGLFGAHLMLVARDAERDAEEDRLRERSTDKPSRPPARFDQSRFDYVMGNVRALLGADHPDVVALATQVTGQALDELGPVTAPPMLWRSWLLLIEASNVVPRLVPVDLWRRTLKLLPVRPFLVWSPEVTGTDVEAWEHEMGLALARAQNDTPESRGPAERGADLAPDAGVPTGDQSRRRLSRELLAPRMVIDELAAGGPR